MEQNSSTNKMKETMIKNISMDRQYRTVDGSPVTLLSVDAPVDSLYVVVGVMNGSITSWTSQGKYRNSTVGRFDLIEVSKYDDYKIDDPVLVRDRQNGTWVPGHFAGVDPAGLPTTWPGGVTSWTAAHTRNNIRYIWNECRRPTTQEEPR